MNFFEHQDRARSSTRKLVLLFACAVITLIVITTVLVVVVINMGEQQQGQPLADTIAFSPQILLGVSIVVVSVVLLGSLYRTLQLRGGGSSIAESLNGRLLNTQTRDADERKILNVVEEMAIAAGLPVPPVYLLEDPAINAFAAGYDQQDAVIGVTRGCIRQLSREELQGVIAHEYSHIFNGDMRLNIRLIGWLYGIMVIGMIGYYMMWSSHYRHVGGGRNNNKGGIVLLGLGLMIIGYSGTFFGNLIKAAVSRQREFLADASAVQFTRNPEGISGALKKIGGASAGSRITSVNTAEISHMLFEEGRQKGFASLLATHPSLDERIRRIDPRWDGNFIDASLAGETTVAPQTAAPPKDSSTVGLGVLGVLATIGEPAGANLGEAQRRLRQLPEGLKEEVHNTLGACLAMFALIVASADQAEAGKQIGLVKASLNAASFALFMRLYEQVKDLDRTLFLPLTDLALPGLKQLSAAQYGMFMSQLNRLIQEDQHISLFEWCLFRILRHNLDRHKKRGKAATELNSCASESRILLSALAVAGHDNEAAARAAYDAGIESLELSGTVPQGLIPALDLDALDQAVSRLQSLRPLQKPRLLKAMARCIEKDGIVASVEGELLRATGAILDCPIPPLPQAT